MSRAPVYNVPIAVETCMFETAFGAVKNHLRDDLANLKSRTIGPMPVRAFLDQFLPLESPDNRTHFLSPGRAFKPASSKGQCAELTCGKLIASLNKKTVRKSRCPGFVFASRPSDPPSQTEAFMCCYTVENLSVVEQLSPDPHTKMGYAELFLLDVRLKLTHDYFEDPYPTLSHSALELLPLRACYRDRNVASEAEPNVRVLRFCARHFSTNPSLGSLLRRCVAEHGCG